MTYQQGKVTDVWSTEEPMTSESCLGVETDATDVTMSPWNRPCNAIYIQPHALVPAVGDVIGWGPNHWWLADDKAHQFHKLGNSFNRDDPLH